MNETTLAGMQIKAFLFICRKCEKHNLMYANNGLTVTSALAEKWVREEGWSKKQKNWYCSNCKNKGKVII